MSTYNDYIEIESTQKENKEQIPIFKYWFDYKFIHPDNEGIPHWSSENRKSDLQSFWDENNICKSEIRINYGKCESPDEPLVRVDGEDIHGWYWDYDTNMLSWKNEAKS